MKRESLSGEGEERVSEWGVRRERVSGEGESEWGG